MIIFYGELAITAKLFRHITNALCSITVPFPFGNRHSIYKQRRGGKWILHRQQSSIILSLQHNFDFAFLVR